MLKAKDNDKIGKGGPRRGLYQTRDLKADDADKARLPKRTVKPTPHRRGKGKH